MSSDKQDSPQLVPSPIDKDTEPDFKIQKKTPIKFKSEDSVKDHASKRSRSESKESKPYRFVS